MSDPVVLLSTGDVVGPAGGVTDNSMVLFSGTSGKLIKGNNAVVTAAGLALLDDVNAAAQKVTLGLGNVDNTSDVDKPISTATQTALNLKAPLASPLFTGAPKAPTASPGTNTTQLATTAFVQASTPLNLKTSGIAGTFSNLKASATGTNATVTVTADSICLKNASNEQIVVNALALAINSATVGANGLDTGVLAASTWYAVWVIWDGATTAGLLSLSATAPTMPGGYTHKARIGWLRTDSTANKYPLSFLQAGFFTQYRVASGSNVLNLPIMVSGVLGSCGIPTWSAVAVTKFVPTTASAIRISVRVNPAARVIVAPNNSYDSFSSTTNSPPVALSVGTDTDTVVAEMLLESANIYYAGDNPGGQVFCMGWVDNF